MKDNEIYLKEDFDKDLFDSYKKKHDYTNAISYLKKFQMPTNVEQSELNRAILDLENEKLWFDSMLSKTNDTDAVKFSIGIKNGIIDDNTSYGLKFAKELNRLGKKGDGIKITFEDNSTYDNFIQNLALQGKDIENRDITIGQNNGKNYLELSKSNISDIADIINILPDIMLSYDKPPIVGPYTIGRNNPITVTGLNGDQDIPNSTVGFSELTKLKGIIRKCNNKFDEATFANEIQLQEYQQPLIVTPFKGAKHQKLYDYLNNKQITPDQYNKYLNIINQQYEDKLISGSLAKKEIYLDQGDSNFEKLTDVDKINEYNRIIRTAVAEGNRVTFNAAMSGNKFGTIITIRGKADSKGVIPERGKNLNSNAEYRFFVPDLFNDSVEESFNADTKTRAIKEYNLLKLGSGSKSLGDSIYINNISDYGGIYLDAKTNYMQELSREEVLNYLNEFNMMSDAFNHYKYEYNKIKDNTNLYFNGKEIGIRKDKNQLGAEMAYSCLAMAKELIPDDDTKDYKEKAYNMYIKLLTEIGYDGERYLDIIRNSNNK